MNSSRTIAVTPAAALGWFCAQVAVSGMFLLFVAERREFATEFVSAAAWEWWLLRTGGSIYATPTGPGGQASLGVVVLVALLLCGIANVLIAKRRARAPEDQPRGARPGSFPSELFHAVRRSALWMVPMAGWVLIWFMELSSPTQFGFGVLLVTAPLTLAVLLAGWTWEFLVVGKFVRSSVDMTPNRARLWVAAAIAAYTVTFTALNWGLWSNLLIPHGDSSMYEEHLWNVLHGKGFRSYLDQGLFLGEHIQVIHLLLVPAYLLWPSHPFMEFAQSLCIALVAIPVYRLALLHGGSQRAAVCLAAASLLYFPLQYLDIAIDLKTFRPTALAIAPLLMGIDAMERRRWGAMTAWYLLALSSQEDFAIPIAMLGLWLAVTSLWELRRGTAATHPGARPYGRAGVIVGGLVFALSTGYLFAAVNLFIPWFRDGEKVHYVRYFEKFGDSAPEIVWTMLTKPGLVLGEFLHPSSIAYLLMLLVPLGRPLRAWPQLLVGLPLYLLLCLNTIAQATPGPFHHFHAPLIPIVLWAACASLGRRNSTQDDDSTPATLPPAPSLNREGENLALAPNAVANSRAVAILCLAAWTQLFYTFAPTGLHFWDTGHRLYWRRLYVPDERAREFAKIPPLIPVTARVASTDFVHPRFTHYERSYDYSDYPRRVSDYLPKVPDDTDFIVLDTAHPYSAVRSLEQVRELREHPDEWDVVPVDTRGYYIVLRRKNSPLTAPTIP